MGSGAVSVLPDPPPFVALACSLVLTLRPVAARGAGLTHGLRRSVALPSPIFTLKRS